MKAKLVLWIKSPFFSSRGFFARGILILFIYVILELLGLREYTSFITGTTSGTFWDIAGMSYFIAYSMYVFLFPIFLIASVFMLIFEKKIAVSKIEVVQEKLPIEAETSSLK